jgi:PAS domain S-box-containing protein
MALVERHEADDIMTELHPEEMELYKSMFWKNTSIGILIDAADGAILYANPSACRFYGYKPESFQRMSIRDIDHSLNEKQMHEYIHRTFAMKKEILNSSHRIMTGENKNVEIHSTPLMMENKKMIFCIIHDVTEQKEFENQLFDYIGSLRRLNDDLSRYALNLAKNVQAPLFAVHRYTNAMIKKLKAAIVNKVPAIKQDL